MNAIYKCGNEALLGRRKTAFLCSRKTPVGVDQAVNSWLESLRAEHDCVLCGDQSGMERMVFSRLLSAGIPTVLVLAQAMPGAWSAGLQAAMQAGRLLVITHCDASVHWANARSAHDRNLLMIGLADEVAVGFCTQGGNLSRELVNARSVRYLFSADVPYSSAQNAQGSIAGEPRPASVSTAEQSWKRRMWSVNKALTIELCGHGGDSFFKIWQVTDFDTGDGQSSFIKLNLQELVDFHEALGDVIIRIGEKNLSDVRAAAVNSAAGRVSFDFKMLTHDGVLVVTQRLETKFMGVRRSAVLLNAREIRTFYEKVSEAADKACEVLKR